jgi:hypothetical protein
VQNVIQLTLALWMECAREAARAVARSPLAMVALMSIAPVLALVNLKLAPHLGLLGGFMVGLLQAIAAGWYLALVEIAATGRRRVGLIDLYEQLGSYVSEVISVMFVFFVLSLLFSGFAATPLGLAVVLGLAIAFNPTPEMITQERSQSLELLGDAFRFMRQNGPEWLVPQIGATVVTALIDLALSGRGVGLDQVVNVLMTFGPFFGFIRAGAFASPISGGSPSGVIVGIVSLAFVHWFMVFRAILYARLRGSSRRGRAWAGKAR